MSAPSTSAPLPASVASGVPAPRAIDPMRGVVMLIVLLALCAMSIAGAALFRSVDAATAVTGGLALRQAALAVADLAIDDAVARLFERGAAGSLEDDVPAQAYFATLQPDAALPGLPAVLFDDAALAALGALEAGDFRLYQVVERLCDAAGTPSPEQCTLLPPETTLAAGSTGATPPPRWPLYRQSIRVDGPAHTRVFVQATLTGRPGQRRLQWRAPAE